MLHCLAKSTWAATTKLKKKCLIKRNVYEIWNIIYEIVSKYFFEIILQISFVTSLICTSRLYTYIYAIYTGLVVQCPKNNQNRENFTKIWITYTEIGKIGIFPTPRYTPFYGWLAIITTYFYSNLIFESGKISWQVWKHHKISIKSLQIRIKISLKLYSSYKEGLHPLINIIISIN